MNRRRKLQIPTSNLERNLKVQPPITKPFQKGEGEAGHISLAIFPVYGQTGPGSQMRRFVQEFVLDPWVAGLLAFALLLIAALSWWIVRQRWNERKYRQKVERRRTASKAKALAKKQSSAELQNQR